MSYQNIKNYFLDKDNIILLWEVISDEKIFRYLSPDIQQKIYNLFLSNINDFFIKEKNISKSLVELNKKYVILINNYIKKTYPINNNKIKINDNKNEDLKELITFEEIQNERKNEFDNKLIELKKDFEDNIIIKKPPQPNFTYDIKETPIKEMDKMIKEMSLKRNYDMEIINNKLKDNVNNEKIHSWLNIEKNNVNNDGNNDNNIIEKNDRKNDNKNIKEKNEKLNKTGKISWGPNIYVDENYKLDNNIIEKNDEDIEVTLFLPINNIKEDNNKELINYQTEKILLLEEEIKNMNLKINKILEVVSSKKE